MKKRKLFKTRKQYRNTDKIRYRELFYLHVKLLLQLTNDVGKNFKKCRKYYKNVVGGMQLCCMCASIDIVNLLKSGD